MPKLSTMQLATARRDMRPSSWIGSGAASILLSAALGLAGGVALVAKPQLVVALVAIAVTLLGLAVAYTYPSVAFGGLVLVAVFLPSYASPSVGPLLVIPAAAASWALAGALGWRNLVERGRLFRPNAIDLAVSSFVLLMCISSLLSPRGTRGELLHVMFLWAGPYLGSRLLLPDVKRPAWVIAASFGLATSILAPIALFEYLGGTNLFHSLNFNSTEFQVWAEQSGRFGQTRAEASFGHPIALSMFAATSAVLSLAMALTAEEGRERALWYLSAALAVFVQVMTVSRTGWLILVIGAMLVAMLFVHGRNRQRLITLVLGAGVALLLVSALAPSALDSVPGFEKSESAVASSSQYREALLDRALEPGVLGAWGNAQNEVTPYVNFGTATDNAYIILADTWGLIPTAALFLVGLMMLWTIARWYGNDPEGGLVVPTVAFGNLVAIFFVAFITQQQVFIWLLIGAAAVAAERCSAAAAWRRSQRGAVLDRR